MIRRAALAALACACARHDRLDDCDGDLGGTWRDQAGQRWNLIAGASSTWEMYPMFDDRPRELPPGVVAAPSVLDLPRGAESPDGMMTRRFEHGADACAVRTVARLHDCKGDRFALDVRPPSPPSLYVCPDGELGPAPGEAPTETWSLERE